MIDMEWGVVVSLIGLALAVVGAVWARDRAITNKIHANHEDITAAAKDGDDVLHKRINRVRDDISDTYVRRADLDGHLARIETGLSGLKSDMKDANRDTNQRLDAVLAAISHTTKT